jgi:four helix bundle protein
MIGGDMEKRPHENLVVWNESVRFVKDVYRLTGRFPGSERYGLTSQLRRAAVSIPTNLAEGASRKTRKEYIQFLYVARGSLSEMETLLYISEQLEFTENQTYDTLRIKTESLGKMLTALINSLKG